MTLGVPVDKHVAAPPTPTRTELEATAWAEVNKAALAIVKDSIEQILTDLNPRYTFGYIGGFGYKTVASRPLLDHKLENAIMAQTAGPTVTIDWKQVYDDLVLKLPPDLQQRFLAQIALPLDQRNYVYTVLDNVLTVAAQVLNGLDTLSQPVDPGSLRAARTVYNLLLPFAALNHTLSLGSEMGKIIDDYITAQGPNFRDFDVFNNILNQMHGTLGIVDAVLANLKQLQPGDNLSAEDKARVAQAAEQFTNMANQLQISSHSREMQVLISSLKAMATIAGSLSLPYTGSAPLYLGLSIATTGIDSSTSQTGVIGRSLRTSIDTLIDGIVSTTMPNSNPAERKFLNMLTTLGFATAVGLSFQAAVTDFGPLPVNENAFRSFVGIDPATISLLAGGMSVGADPWYGLISAAVLAICVGAQALSATDEVQKADLNMARFLTFASTLHLVTSSNFIQEFFKEIVAISGGNERAQNVAAPILAQVANILIAIAGTGNDKRYLPAHVLEEEFDQLEQGVQAANELSAGNESTDTAKAAAVTVGQLQRALEEKNYTGFMESFNTILEGLGTTQAATLADINALRQTIAAMLVAANDKDDEHSRIGIVNVV